MSEPIHIGNCPECGHFPSQLVGSDSALHYVIHLPDKSNCQAGPHKRIHELEAQLKQAEARVAVQFDALTSIAVALKEAGNLTKEMHDFIVEATDGNSEAILLRKQAEAVERAAMNFGGRDYSEVRFGLCEWAKHLRQQADEIEKGSSE